MSKELIVNSSVHETRLAILENDRLVELYIEQESQHALAGSIFKGRVTRVLPGMQSAFVDIGLERDGFLYVSDFLEENEDLETAPTSAPRRSSERPREAAPEKANGEADATTDVTAGPTETGGKADPATAGEEASGDGNSARRGRRGRRSRRRRGRSGERPAAGSAESGFPNEKYAAVSSGDEANGDEPADNELATDERTDKDTPATANDRPDRDAEAANKDRGFTVLPGESLAKYSDSTASTVDASEDDALEELRADDAYDSAYNPDSSVSDEAPGGGNGGEDDEPSGFEHQEAPVKAGSGQSLDPRSNDNEPDEQADRALSVEAIVAETDPDAASISGQPARPDEEPFENDDTDTPGELEIEAAAITADEAGDEGVVPELEEPDQEYADSEAEPGDEFAPDQELLPEDAPETIEASDGDRSGDLDPRMPGRPLPGEAESDAEQAASEGEEDSEPPREGEARQRTRSASAGFERRRGRRGRRRGRREGHAAEMDEAPSEAGNRGDEGPKISDLLARGQEVLVQISKEPLGKKGARITSHIALPGRFLVYMPTVNHTGVSRKIASDKERARLRKIVQTHNTGMAGGFIVRTAGDGVSEEDLRGDMLFLYNLWLDIREKSENCPPASLVHHDDDVVERVLRDRLGEDFKTIWVDSEEEYERILRFVERFQPDLLRAVKLYTRTKPIFDSFNISTEIEKAIRPKVWLKSGGYIVINPTEALVSIDVNTGKYVGKSDRLEDTIVNTNLEAVQEIARQLRIRDLGGIIVVDFIDMEERGNRQKVMAALEKELRIDIAPSKALPFNEFGLVAITRKRVKQSLERSLCSPCPYCKGASYVKSVQSVIYEILTNARKMVLSKEPKKDMTLRVNQEVARKLKSRDNNYLQELEQIFRANVLVRGDVSLHRDHFDIH